MAVLSRADRLIFAAAGGLAAASAALHFGHGNQTLTFIVSAFALAAIAALVGNSIEQVAERLSSGATGVVQGALGNLPELFFGIFATMAPALSWLRLRSTTSWPAAAATSAMPEPMIPDPTIPTRVIDMGQEATGR